MMRKFVAAVFYGWGKGIKKGQLLGKHKQQFLTVLSGLQDILNAAGQEATNIIKAADKRITAFNFSLPHNNLEDFLGRLDFYVEEQGLKGKISVANEGSGIQSFTIFTMLRLLFEFRATNTFKGSKFLWLIEEPETFMHFDLQRKTFEQLKEYARDGYIFISTHSPVFIDKEEYGNTYQVISTDKGTQAEHVTPESVIKVITGHLGLKFDDLGVFKRFNVLVEGESDKKLLLALNELFMAKNLKNTINTLTVQIIPCEGSGAIEHFYKLYNAFNRYVDFMALFDNDGAGQKSRESLIHAGFDKRNLILLPNTNNKAKGTAIEDLVKKKVWDECLRKLDADGLVTLHTEKNEIVDYDCKKKRSEFKKQFSNLLIEEARKDLAPFELYKGLIQAIATSAAVADLT